MGRLAAASSLSGQSLGPAELWTCLQTQRRRARERVLCRGTKAARAGPAIVCRRPASWWPRRVEVPAAPVPREHTAAAAAPSCHTPAPGTAQPRPSSVGGSVLPNRTHRPALEGTRQDSIPDSVFSPCFISAPAGPQNHTGAPARGPPLPRAVLQEAARRAVGSSHGRGRSPPPVPQGSRPPSLCRPVQTLGLAAWDSRGSVRRSSSVCGSLMLGHDSSEQHGL